MTFAEAVAVPCTKIFGCGIGTENAAVLDRASAVPSAIIFNFHGRVLPCDISSNAAFNRTLDCITLSLEEKYVSAECHSSQKADSLDD